MAEGWARKLKSAELIAYSAGLEAHGLNPYAVEVMAEAGVDITTHKSQQLPELADIGFDYVVTVCDHAHETCPLFPTGARVVHVGFDDPPRLAATVQDQEAKLDIYRRVRDEIRNFVQTLPTALVERDA